MTLAAVRQLLQQTFHHWAKDYAPSMGAALVHYSVFSMSPLLLRPSWPVSDRPAQTRVVALVSAGVVMVGAMDRIWQAPARPNGGVMALFRGPTAVV